MVYHRARLDREAARAPIPEPPAVAEARAREAKAQAVERQAQAEAKAAQARRDALAALTPTGWRRAWWWARGQLGPHQAALAEAMVTARNATDMARVHSQVATGMTFGVGVEEEKAERRRAVELQRQRQAEAVATLTMERAAIAADLLRADPVRGALAVPDLMQQAEAERRRREAAEEARETLEAVSSGPGPR